MAIGTVKWFNTTKGFGFIMPQDGGKDVFVHITAVQAAGLKGLNDGQKLSYDVAMERGKAAATNTDRVFRFMFLLVFGGNSRRERPPGLVAAFCRAV